MERTMLPKVLETERPTVPLGKTVFTTAEYFLIYLSYFIFFLTFPIAIIFCLKTVTVFERIVVFRLGKVRSNSAMGPGLVFVLPCVDEYAKVDLRTRSFNVSPQEIITSDSVSIRVDAVVYYSVQNPLYCVVQIAQVGVATKLLAQATLRNVVGTKYLMEVLTSKETLSKAVEQILDEATQKWGVKVERVEVKQIHLPANMQRAMAAEQEADREAQAKIAAARGELYASTNLKAASDVMKGNAISLQLRYLQTLNSIASENNHTVIFPFPLDLMKRLLLNLRNYIFAEDLKGGDPVCCTQAIKVNKKLQTNPELVDIGV